MCAFFFSLYVILKRCIADGLRAGWPSACLGSESKTGTVVESLWLKRNPVGLDLNLSVGFFKFILAGCYLKSADHTESIVAS